MGKYCADFKFAFELFYPVEVIVNSEKDNRRARSRLLALSLATAADRGRAKIKFMLNSLG